MRVLVTGGTGFLGKAIVARLLARGDSVRVLARGRRGTALPDGVEFHQGDVADLGGVANAVRGCDLVVHTAALPALSRVAWAQAYPARPVRLVAPVAVRPVAARARSSVAKSSTTWRPRAPAV